MNQYLAVGGTSQTFDADGNLTSSSGPSGPRSYSYNSEEQLTSVVTSRGLGPTNTTLWGMAFRARTMASRPSTSSIRRDWVTCSVNTTGPET